MRVERGGGGVTVYHHGGDRDRVISGRVTENDPRGLPRVARRPAQASFSPYIPRRPTKSLRMWACVCVWGALYVHVRVFCTRLESAAREARLNFSPGRLCREPQSRRAVLSHGGLTAKSTRVYIYSLSRGHVTRLSLALPARAGVYSFVERRGGAIPPVVIELPLFLSAETFQRAVMTD